METTTRNRHTEQLIDKLGVSCRPVSHRQQFNMPPPDSPRWRQGNVRSFAQGPRCVAMSGLAVQGCSSSAEGALPLYWGWEPRTPYCISSDALHRHGELPGLWIDPWLDRYAPECVRNLSLLVEWTNSCGFSHVELSCICWVVGECTPENPCLDYENCPNCATFPSGSGG